jgi:chaperonin GroES
MSVNVQPLADRVLVRRLEEENKTASGIIIPDNSKEKPSEGEIVAVGSGYTNTDGSQRALSVKVGDRVLFEKWGGTEVKVAGEEFLIMKEEKILGILQ